MLELFDLINKANIGLYNWSLVLNKFESLLETKVVFPNNINNNNGARPTYASCTVHQNVYIIFSELFYELYTLVEMIAYIKTRSILSMQVQMNYKKIIF